MKSRPTIGVMIKPQPSRLRKDKNQYFVAAEKRRVALSQASSSRAYSKGKEVLQCYHSGCQLNHNVDIPPNHKHALVLFKYMYSIIQ